MRRLALFFASDIYSAAFTLSVFMGGLTLGSLVAAPFLFFQKSTASVLPAGTF